MYIENQAFEFWTSIFFYETTSRFTNSLTILVIVIIIEVRRIVMDSCGWYEMWRIWSEKWVKKIRKLVPPPSSLRSHTSSWLAFSVDLGVGSGANPPSMSQWLVIKNNSNRKIWPGLKEAGRVLRCDHSPELLWVDGPRGGTGGFSEGGCKNLLFLQEWKNLWHQGTLQWLCLWIYHFCLVKCTCRRCEFGCRVLLVDECVFWWSNSSSELVASPVVAALCCESIDMRLPPDVCKKAIC